MHVKDGHGELFRMNFFVSAEPSFVSAEPAKCSMQRLLQRSQSEAVLAYNTYFAPAGAEMHAELNR